MIHAPLSTTSVLDEAADAVRVALPWTALLLAAALPWRFLQIVFADRLLDLGSDASRYGTYLRSAALMAMIAFLVSRWGRLVYARAIRLVHANGKNPGRETLRVPPSVLADYVFIATFTELLSSMTAITFVGPPLCTMLSGSAIGTAELNTTASISEPFRNIARAKESKIVFSLLLVFACAFVVAFINVAAAFALGYWLVSGTGWFDAQRWAPFFSINNRRFVLAAIGCALLTLEPFWVAAHVMLVRKAGAAQSGEDLRAWFEELRRA